MPRIAATLASLLLIASSIGVNIARYPVVWQMVSGLDAPGSPAATAPGPTKPPPGSATVHSTTPSVPAKPAPTVSRKAPAKKDTPAASPAKPKPMEAAAAKVASPTPTKKTEASASPASQAKKPAAPEKKKTEIASSAESKEKPPAPNQRPKELAKESAKEPPKSPLPSAAKPSSESDRSEPVGHILAVRPLVPVVLPAGTEDEVRRLPPVDPNSPVSGNSPSAFAGDSPPSYPSTGAL